MVFALPVFSGKTVRMPGALEMVLPVFVSVVFFFNRTFDRLSLEQSSAVHRAGISLSLPAG